MSTTIEIKFKFFTEIKIMNLVADSIVIFKQT